MDHETQIVGYLALAPLQLPHTWYVQQNNSSISCNAVSLSGIMVSRSRALQPRLAPWVESLGTTTSGTPSLMPLRVLAVAR